MHEKLLGGDENGSDEDEEEVTQNNSGSGDSVYVFETEADFSL